MGLAKKLVKLYHRTKDELEVLKGKKSKDRIYYTRKTFDTLQEAETVFKEATSRLFDINNWSNVNIATSKFVLYNSNAKPTSETKPQKDYYIKVNLPGPTPDNWVIVINVKEDVNTAEFTVSPCPNPTIKDQNDLVTEHFFKSNSTSTFRVSLRDRIVSAYEIGRNESINNRQPEAGKRSAINTAISEVGWAGFQTHQWQNLTDYFMYGGKPPL
jgi:hypothetical protein